MLHSLATRKTRNVRQLPFRISLPVEDKKETQPMQMDLSSPHGCPQLPHMCVFMAMRESDGRNTTFPLCLCALSSNSYN